MSIQTHTCEYNQMNRKNKWMLAKCLFSAFLFFFLMLLIIYWSRIICSAVDLPFLPPAWLFDIFMILITRSLIIRSSSFPKLLDNVIPRSFDNLPILLLTAANRQHHSTPTHFHYCTLYYFYKIFSLTKLFCHGQWVLWANHWVLQLITKGWPHGGHSGWLHSDLWLR